MELLQIPAEFAPVEKLYRELAPTRVLEIGCWDGGTLKVWLEGCGPAATVVAVDPAHRNPGAYPGWTKPGTTLVVVDGRSQDTLAVEAIRANAPYQWVMIDGDHSDEAVRADVSLCLPLIEPGGVMVLHDITPQAGNHSTAPRDVLNELEAQGYRVERFEEINKDPWTHGLGLVYL